jgi:threonine dehydrogenase-like Zn-dependent dehydrogenase
VHALLMPGDRQIDIVERDIPKPASGQVLIQMQAAGLCGSDLHMQYSPTPAERHGEFYGLKTDPSIVVGHEPAGIVVELGAGTEHLRIGDRVAVHHMAGCGHCMACRRGWDINCENKWGVYGTDRDGAMQDFMVARERDCVVVPDEVSMAEACYYACGAGTGFLALKRGDFGPGDTVAVVGLGPVGLAAGFFASRAGAKVIGFDTQTARNEFAMQAGVTQTFDPRDDTTAEAFLDATGGHGADVVIEATGRTSGRDLAFSSAGLHARVVCVGFADEVSPLHLQRDVLQKQVDVRGSWMFPIHALDQMLRSVAANGTSIENLIPDRYALEDSKIAWENFDKGSLGKTVISW